MMKNSRSYIGLFFEFITLLVNGSMPARVQAMTAPMRKSRSFKPTTALLLLGLLALLLLCHVPSSSSEFMFFDPGPMCVTLVSLSPKSICSLLSTFRASLRFKFKMVTQGSIWFPATSSKSMASGSSGQVIL